jgi:hypothetical protein
MDIEPVHLSSPSGPARQMIFGLLWLLGGVAITVFTYNAATSSPGGGRYVLAYGPIIYGAITFLRGLGDMAKR